MELNFYLFGSGFSKRPDHQCGSRTRGLLFASLMLLMTSTVCFGQADTVSFSTPGTFVWTCPAGVTSITIQCWGGGGAGGGASPGNQAGGGGGGAAYVIDALPVISLTDYSVKVGAGGIGLPGASGSAGDSSWFSNGSTVLAIGGDGGISGAAGVSGFGQGAAGATGTTCIPSVNSRPGLDGTAAGMDNLGYVVSGAGGAHNPGISGQTGGSAPGVINSNGANGNDGVPIGGGGSGGVGGTLLTTVAGGNGATGRVIINYYPAPAGIYTLNGRGFNASAFPNPASGETTLQFSHEGSDGYVIRISDLAGRELVTRQGNAEGGINNIRLDLAGYAKGIYMLRLQSGDNIRSSD